MLRKNLLIFSKSNSRNLMWLDRSPSYPSTKKSRLSKKENKKFCKKWDPTSILKITMTNFLSWKNSWEKLKKIFTKKHTRVKFLPILIRWSAKKLLWCSIPTTKKIKFWKNSQKLIHLWSDHTLAPDLKTLKSNKPLSRKKSSGIMWMFPRVRRSCSEFLDGGLVFWFWWLWQSHFTLCWKLKLKISSMFSTILIRIHTAKSINLISKEQLLPSTSCYL